MTLKVKDVIDMKNHTNSLGINAYEWFFNNLENNYISKLDGTKRNVSIIEEYDVEAQGYVIHQLFYINEEAANELMRELKIVKPFISEENNKQIIKP